MRRVIFPIDRSSLLARLVLLALLRSTLLELLGFLVGLLDCFADFPLLLACLDGDGHAACSTLFGGIADGAFGVFPVSGSGADFVSASK